MRKYRQDTSIEIAVVTVPSLEGLSVDEYTLELASKWGVGNRKKDNGLVFLVAPNERKARIEVGYGLEGDLTDAQANRIMQNSIVPLFKNRRMADGIAAGVSEILRELGSTPYEARAEEKKIAAKKDAANRARADAMLKTILIFLFAGAVIIGFSVWIMMRIKRYLAWRREMNELHQDNAGILKKIAENIAEIGREFTPAGNIIVSMKKECSKDVWGDLEREWGTIPNLINQMKDGSDAIEKSHSQGWKNAKNTRSLASSLLEDTAARSSFLEKAERKRNEQLDAKKKWLNMLSVFPSRMETVKNNLGHQDITAQAKEYFRSAESIYEAHSKLAGYNLLNWVLIFAALNEADSLLASASNQARNDIEYAARARKEGPRLLESLPESIEKAEKAVDQPDVASLTMQMIADAKEKYSEAKKIVKASAGNSPASPANWVMAFAFILGANTLADEAVKNVASDIADAEQKRRKKKDDEEKEERRRQRRQSESYYSSSSYSSSGGSSSSGSFGGGGFGGGGASGSW